MPELSNIQTFEKLIGSDYQPTLDKFKNVLQRIDLWNDEVKQAFDSFEWKVEDNGFVYSSLVQLGYFKTKFSEIAVRPFVLVYTSAIDNSIKENWIMCELLIESEELRSSETGKYLNLTYDIVRDLTLEMHKEFKQTGVYFTDEAQDGEDFDGVRNSNKKKLWRFDYAIIPSTLEQIYSSPPLTHKIIHHDNYLEACYIDRWKPTDKYRIDIDADQTFREGSADNINQYDFVYFNKSEYQNQFVFGIKVFQDNILIKSAVIGSNGGGTGIHNTSTIIENDRLLICCSSTIFCLSIPDLTLLWRTQADRVTCFGIYKCQDSYIIHGELEISRLDKDGKILWQQSGTDIFTTCDGTDSFTITDNYILATDWANNKYKFDFNGKQIK